MAYSYVVYTGNGSTTQFAITFPYIRKEHVKVYVNYVDTAYTYVNDTTVQLAAAPASPLRVEVRRVTPLSTRLVDYTDGSTLVAADLDTSNLQSLYNEQELDDSLKQTVSIDPATGLPSAGGQRITNVGNPTSAQDAATKSYVDTADALKVNKAGDSMSGALAMGTNKITGLGNPTSAQDGATKTYVDTADALKVAKAGDSMTGPLAMGTNKVTGMGDPTSAQDAATKAYVDTADALKVAKAGDSMTGALAMGSNKITGLGTPTANADAATKLYVDAVTLAGNVPDGDRGDITVSGAGTSWTIDTGAVVEAKLGTGAVTSAKILDGTILNADVNATAGIVASKLSFTQAGASGVARTVDSKLKDTVSVKDFGAVGDGVTDDRAAIQNANNAAAAANTALYFPPGIYGVNIGSGGGSTLALTTSWIGDNSTIKQLNYNNTTTAFLVLIQNQSNLTVSGFTFDGQCTAVGRPVNSDLVNMAADTNTENNWSKTYGFCIKTCHNISVRDCIGKNFLRASFRADADGSPSGTSTNISFIRCQSFRTRGIFGDGFLHAGVNGITYESCYAYDFTRIGFVSEYLDPISSYNVQYVNCLAKYGHDWVDTEHNTGYWVEAGDSTSYTNCISEDVPEGFVGASVAIAGVTGVTRPLTAVINYSNCIASNCGTGWYLTAGAQTTRYNLTNCFSQIFCSDLTVSPHTKTRYYFAGILGQFSFNTNIDVVINIINSACEINNDATTISGPYAGININSGKTVGYTSNFDIAVTGYTTTYTFPAKFLTAAEGAAGNNIVASDFLLRGDQESPVQRADPRVRLDKVVNLTAPAFYIGGLPGTAAGFDVENSKVSVNIPQTAFMSYFRSNSCDLVDIREIGVNLLQICDSKIEHANSSNPAVNNWYASRVFLDRNVITRVCPIAVLSASSSSFRPLLIQISNCDFVYNFLSGPVVTFIDADTGADVLYGLFNSNVFRHTVDGATGTAISGAIVGMGGQNNYVMGADNLFDDRIGVIYRRQGFSFDTDPTNMAGYYFQAAGYTKFGQQFYVGA